MGAGAERPVTSLSAPAGGSRLGAGKKTGVNRSLLEQMFGALLRETSLPAPVREHRPLEHRRYRLDFAWPGQLAGVEIDGGTWLIRGGRHNSDPDREKSNLLLLAGWRVLHFSGTQLQKDPDHCLDQVHQLLGVAR